VAVGVGAGASLVFLAVATRAFWLTRRSVRLAAGLVCGIALLLFAGLIYTHAAVMPASGQTTVAVTTPFQLGAITFMTPLYAFLGVFIFWLWHRSWTMQRQNV
jgi:H+/gluconate symporter-like permease